MNDMTQADALRHPLSKMLPKTPLGPMRVPARMLGWFSIVLGVTELVLPRGVARVAGMPNLPLLTRACGLREIGTGIGLLTSRDPKPWLWARVAGDALDAVTVAPGLVTSGRPLRTLSSLAVVGVIAWVDYTTAQEAVKRDRKRREAGRYDYSNRSGFPKPVSEMRGTAHRAWPSVASPADAGAARGEAGIGGGDHQVTREEAPVAS